LDKKQLLNCVFIEKSFKKESLNYFLAQKSGAETNGTFYFSALFFTKETN